MLSGAELRVLAAALALAPDIEHAEQLIEGGSFSPSDYRLAALGRALEALPVALRMDYAEACSCQGDSNPSWQEMDVLRI